LKQKARKKRVSDENRTETPQTEEPRDNVYGIRCMSHHIRDHCRDHVDLAPSSSSLASPWKRYFFTSESPLALPDLVLKLLNMSSSIEERSFPNMSSGSLGGGGMFETG